MSRNSGLGLWLSVAISLSIATANSFALPSPAPISLDDGVKLYNQKQYKQALPIFLSVLKQNPRSSAAYLYIANCYYALQQLAFAKQTYAIVVQNFPNSREAVTAKDFLQKLQAVGQTATAAATTAKTSAPAAAPRGASTETQIGELTLRVIRPLQDHPAVSQQMIYEVKSKLQGYPPSVRKLLTENNIEVILTTTLVDRNPELKNQEGRGYDGHTYKSCPGMFDGGQFIVICERTMDESSETVKAPFLIKDILDTLNHECGHAIDHCLGDFCETDEFKHAYLLDAASAQRKDASITKDLAYYLQKSSAGQQECCGELIGIILGTEDDKSEKMKAAFPQTIKVLKKKLGLG